MVAWQGVCIPKEKGGLGIKDIGTQNICLLLKLIHRLHSSNESAWAEWVKGRADISSLKGDLHGHHWDTLRALLPLYQAIMSVKLGDGRSCSFWFDVWHGEESLADVCPALLSHHTKKDMSVRDVVTNGIATGLQRRLSNQAALELELVQGILGSLQLQAVPDQRETPFSKRNSSLDSSAIYTLLKARGQPGDERASFIWHSVAPPRVQMLMWLLMKEKIQCRTVLHQKHVLPDSMSAARQGLVEETRTSCSQPDQVCLSADKAVEQGVPTF